MCIICTLLIWTGEAMNKNRNLKRHTYDVLIAKIYYRYQYVHFFTY